MPKVNRESAILWIGAIVALLAYLRASDIPTTWTYDDWIKFASASAAYILGKLQWSPLPGPPNKEKDKISGNGII